MSYRCVGDESMLHNFTIEEYARYAHNLNMLHWRYNKTSELILDPIDVTEDSDEQDGYVRSFNIKCTEDVSKEYIDNISSRAREITGWLVADLSNSVYYRDMFIPSQWISKIVDKILASNQTIKHSYLIQDSPDTTGWVSEDPLPPFYPTCNSDRVKKVFISKDDKVLTYNDSLSRTKEEKLVYLTDMEEKDPRKIIGKSYIDFLNILFKLYVEGTIHKVSDSFVNNWELIEDVKYKGLYHPLWTNSLVAPVKSSYLLKVSIEGKPESYRNVVLGPVIDFFGRPKCL